MPPKTRTSKKRRSRPTARRRPPAGPPTLLRKSHVVIFELQVRIAAVPQRVWRALTEEIARWWLPDFLCAPCSRGIRMEAWPGGRLFEEADNGGGLLWFHVVALTPPRSLHLAGQIIPPYGGPATTLLYISLDKTPSGTLVKVQNSVLGYISRAQMSGTIAGWRQLFEEGLKPYAESPAANE